MFPRISRLRAAGGQVVAVVPKQILAAGLGSETGNNHTGYNSGSGTGTYMDGLPFGSIKLLGLANYSAPGGEVINALYFDDRDNITYLIINGSGKTAWFSGRQVWIKSAATWTVYTCTGAASVGSVTYATVSATQLFTSGVDYAVSFVAP